MRRCARMLALAFAALFAVAPAAEARGASSHLRAGPSILHARPAYAPQLQNTGAWRASPILISGASAYRRGEFLYQDFLYDDHGAKGTGRDPGDPRTVVDAASLPSGTYTYPTAAAYAGNAADLVELRVKPLSTATAFRITLNTLLDPALVATTIAIGDSPSPRQFPHGANASAPAQWFLTVHGDDAELIDAETGATAPVQPTVSLDTRRRQIEVRIPHAAWDPGDATVRLAAGIGLWDAAAGRYLIPQVAADASHPGGGTLSRPPAFFNVAFRYEEDIQRPDLSVLSNPAWWRDRDQGQALAGGDLSGFYAQVDFAKLRAGTDDDLVGQRGGAPQSGPMDRILVSHFETAQGTDYSRPCTSVAAGGFDAACPGELRGRLQPYAVYVPNKSEPPDGWRLTLLLHSFGANYNQFLGSRHMQQFAEREPGSIVITPQARGPTGWYFAYAGADVFEVWADVARRYRLAPRRVAIAGYSMGGYGTWKLAAQFPDLFARAQPTVGPTVIGNQQGVIGSTDTLPLTPSLRHIPFLVWLGSIDQTVPLASARRNADAMDNLGYRYELDVIGPISFLVPDQHFLLALHDQYGPAAEFLDDAIAERDPPRVTYAYNPAMDFREAGLTAGHAYWVSGIRLRSGVGAAPVGTVDVRSHGFGIGDAPANPTEHGTGSLGGGFVPFPLPFTRQLRTWGDPPATPVADRLDVSATNVASLTIDRRRARVSCRAKLNVVSDGPIAVRLSGCKGRNGRNGQHGHFDGHRDDDD